MDTQVGTKKRLDNQALGLLPLLIFMILDNYLNYLISSISALVLSFLSLYIYSWLAKKKNHRFMLLVSAVTLILMAVILNLPIGKALYMYRTLINEIVLVVVLTFIGFFKKYFLRQVRNSAHPLFRRTLLRSSLNEFIFVSEILQNICTLHLFVLLVYNVLPTDWHSDKLNTLLYQDMAILLGFMVILYERIRLSLIRGSLEKEMWLPVLTDEGKVIGCIARSVSRSVPKKYYHPIVRVAVVCNGKLYLVKRPYDAYTNPSTYDYPFEQYVLYRHKIEETALEIISCLNKDGDARVRYLIRYKYEDDRVKHQVYLFVVCVNNEKLMLLCTKESGKLWTSKQIEDNLGKGIFSGYFEKEFPYLQNTILLAENFSCHQGDNCAEEEDPEGPDPEILGNA